MTDDDQVLALKSNGANIVNALIAALTYQRNEALNKLAHAEARITVLTAELAKLQASPETEEASGE